MTSKRTALMATIFAGRDLDKDAAELALNVDVIHGLIAGTGPIQLTVANAVAIGKLTQSDPRAIMLAQLDDRLEEAGVPVDTPAKPVKAKKAAEATPAGSRSPFGGRRSFNLD